MDTSNSHPLTTSMAYGQAMGVIDDAEEHLSGELSRMMIEGSGSGARPVIKLEDRPGCMFGGQGAMFGTPGMYSLSSNSLETDDVSMHSSYYTQLTPSNLLQQLDQKPLEGFGSQGQGQGQVNFPRSGSQQDMTYQYEVDTKRRYDGTCTPGLEGPVQAHEAWQKQMSLSEKGDSLGDSLDDQLVYTAEVDEQGDCILHIASMMTDPSLLNRLLVFLEQTNVVHQCINLENKQKQTPLFCAVQARNIHLMVWLLSKGADPNIQGTLYVDRDEYVWRAPLHMAAAMGDQNIDYLNVLLKSPRLDINLLSTADKLTPLHLALKSHKPNHFICRQIILQLLSSGASFSVREQSSSKTPLIMAIETQDLDLLHQILVSFPADRRRALLQERTRSGDTCLHVAAGLSRMESSAKERMLRLLITNGANGGVHNNAKELPRDYARKEWDTIRNF